MDKNPIKTLIETLKILNFTRTISCIKIELLKASTFKKKRYYWYHMDEDIDKLLNIVNSIKDTGGNKIDIVTNNINNIDEIINKKEPWENLSNLEYIYDKLLLDLENMLKLLKFS